jgi:hypothetical protein
MAKTEMYTTKAGERRFQVAAPVSEEVYEELRRLAYEQRTTLSAQVRQAVIDYVTHRSSIVRSLTAVPPARPGLQR